MASPVPQAATPHQAISPQATPSDDDVVTLRWGRRRALGALLRGLFALSLSAALALDTRVDGGLRALGAAFSLLLILAMARRTWRSLQRRPVLVLDRLGFQPLRSLVGPVPWTAVTTLRVTSGGRLRILHATLDPVTAASLVPRWRRRLALRLGLAEAARVKMVVSSLDRSAAEVVAIFEARCPAGVRARPVPDEKTRRAEAALAARPWFAYALMAALAIIMGVELVLRLGGGRYDNLSPLTLWALGASQRLAIVRDGQWWRLVTATLLHGGILHLLLNGVALWFAARLLERVIGWRWFAATFAVSAVCGSGLSMLWNAPSQVGVGASGGILGLSAATAVVAWHFGPGRLRTRLLVGALQILVPSLLPVGQGVGGLNVDLAGHVGGALGGAAMGSLVSALWPKEALRPRHDWLGAALAGLYVAVAAGSMVPIERTYGTGEAVTALDPSFPTAFGQAIRRGKALVDAYPRDPRARAAYAEALVARGDVAGAEAELRKALDDEPMLRPDVLASFEPILRVRLAQLMVDHGEGAGAAAVVDPICGVASGPLKSALAEMRLCRRSH